jgi:small subunit ribosomal protein S9
MSNNNQEVLGQERKPVKDALGRSYGTGRRKNAVARVWIKAGSGKVTVNGLDVDKYFPRATTRYILLQPFGVTKTAGQFDVICTTNGGGHTGQAGAILLGISRALDKFEPAYHDSLRQGGFLTRDARVVERKKYGQHKARKSTQFSKR